ncbi:MAG: hypothetical protein ACFFCS_14770 [Candidatus Hodarchaeota archaeon]
MDEENLTEEELMKLTKSQLVNYILKNIKKRSSEGPPQISIKPPPSIGTVNHPPKIPPMNTLRISQKDYGKLDSATPPPIPNNPNVPNKPKNILKEEEIKGKKKIFVKCEKCDKTYIIDLPRKIVLANPLEVVPVTILHAEDHALTVYLDQNFESRRDYISEIYTLEKKD